MSATLGYLFQINADAIEFVIKESGRVDNLSPFFVNLISQVMLEQKLYTEGTIGKEARLVTYVTEQHLDAAFDYLQKQINLYM